jgi:hypothetical protein
MLPSSSRMIGVELTISHDCVSWAPKRLQQLCLMDGCRGRKAATSMETAPPL